MNPAFLLLNHWLSAMNRGKQTDFHTLLAFAKPLKMSERGAFERRGMVFRQRIVIAKPPGHDPPADRKSDGKIYRWRLSSYERGTASGTPYSLDFRPVSRLYYTIEPRPFFTPSEFPACENPDGVSILLGDFALCVRLHLNRAYIIQNVASMRAEPDARAEQVSQAILGDPVTILEETDDYTLIRTPDDYCGWTRSQWLRSAEEISALPTSANAEAISEHAQGMVRLVRPIMDFKTGLEAGAINFTKLVFGTTVRLCEPPDPLSAKANRAFQPVRIFTGEVGYISRKSPFPVAQLCDFDAALAVQFAYRFIGTPYLWGGTTSFGYDCSGFLQRLYSIFGIILPRDAYQQAVSPLGATVPRNECWEAGDLVFFTSSSDPLKRGITHVGMAIDNDSFIHASGKLGVAITPREDAYYTKHLHSVWRLNCQNKSNGSNPMTEIDP